MSTTDPTCTAVLPDGKKITTTSVNPLLNGKNPVQITFINPRPNSPLPPLVQASIVKDSLDVSAVVFIDSSVNTSLGFIVYQDCVVKEGIPYLHFYICYDIPESTASTFNAYQVNFKADSTLFPKGVSLSDIKFIVTFSWDSDPVTSRGTETTVQPAS